MFNNNFFKGKICMNPSKDPPSDEFNEVFEQWISWFANENPHIGLVLLKSHYRMDPLLELDSLKDVMDGSSRNVNFLNSKSGRIFHVFPIMNFLNKDPNVHSITEWMSVLSNLLP